jgi:acyl-CoA reductase-like NAD-dependent aldehyde dehydrogenase
MKKLIALAMVAAVAFTGCSAAMASVSGPVSESSGKHVQAETSSMNILMLMPMSLEKAGEAVKTLSSQCSGSEVVNMTSHWKTTSYGPISFETLSVSGYCK